GKTTLTESILFNAGKERIMGNVDEGTTTTDWMLQERERGISITSAVTTIPWGEYSFNIVDTPGHVDFTAEVERCLRVLDGAVVVFCGVNGVEAQSETVWRQASKYKIPRLVYVNKCDRVGANFENVTEEIKKKFEICVIPLTIPLYENNKLIGVIDILEEKEYLPVEFEKSTVYQVQDVRAAEREYLEFWQQYMLELLAEFSPGFVKLSIHQIKDNMREFLKTIRELTINFFCVPLFTGSALKNVGVHNLLNGICNFLPAPSDIEIVEGKNPYNENQIKKVKRSSEEAFVGLIFKTMTTKYDDISFMRIYSGKVSSGDILYNWRTKKKERIQRIYLMYAIERQPITTAQAGDIVGIVGLKDTATGDTLTSPDFPFVLESIDFPEPVVFSSIEPKFSADREKLVDVLKKLAKDDPTFKLKYDEDNNQFLIYGMGELHLEIVWDRILREFNVESKLGTPYVSYKEAPTKVSTVRVNYQKKVQDKLISVKIGLSLQRNKENKKNSIVFSKNLSEFNNELRETIKNSIFTALMTGGKYGYPIIESEFIVDSIESEHRDISHIIEEAAYFTAQQAIKENDFCILEPIMKLSISSPLEYMGNIIDDLNKRRAEINEIKNTGLTINIFAFVPVAEVIGYALSLRSLSKGLASFTLEPYDYKEIPPELQKKLFAIY
ncbi:MAG: elongation factor G, partial [Planctomycetota bacterium]